MIQLKSIKYFVLLITFSCWIINLVNAQVKWQTQNLVNGGRIDALADLGGGVVILGTRGANPGIILRSTDFGITWKKTKVLDEPADAYHNNEILGLMGDNEGNAYLITSNAQFWRSMDKGVTWERTAHFIEETDRFAYSYSICVTAQGTVLVTTGKYVFRSTDKGTHFEKIGPITDHYLYRLQLVGHHIFTNGWGGTLYKSQDDGKTWQFFAKLGPESDLTSKDIMKSQPFLTAIDYMGADHVLQGTMAGENYIINPFLPERLRKSTIEGSLDDYVCLGYNAVIATTFTKQKDNYISYDGGLNWENIGKVPTGIEGDWLDHIIKIDKPDSVIAVGGTNKGFVVRTAFSRKELFHRLASKEDKPKNIPGKTSNPVVGVLTDYFDLNEPEDILIDGNYAYIPCRIGNNLAVVDITDATKPVLASSFRDKELQDAMGVAKNGSYIYLTSMSNERCLVVDASNPKKLKKLYSFRVGGANQYPNTLRKVIYEDGYLYFTHDGEGTLYIADARNPVRPEVISKVKVGKGAFAVALKGNRAYIGGCIGSSSLEVVDITDRSSPKLLEALESPEKYGCISSFVLEGNTLHAVGWYSKSYMQFDISNPNQIKEKAFFQSPLVNMPNRMTMLDGDIFTVNSTGNSVTRLNIKHGISVSGLYSHALLQKAYGINCKNHLIYAVSRDAKSLVIIDPKKM